MFQPRPIGRYLFESPQIKKKNAENRRNERSVTTSPQGQLLVMASLLSKSAIYIFGIGWGFIGKHKYCV
jgi:hypothetical protein